MSRISTLRTRKVPARFTVDNSEDVVNYHPYPSPKKPRAHDASGALASSSREIANQSRSAPSSTTSVTLTITNRTSPNYILGFKEGTFYYPNTPGQDVFPASDVRTVDGVTHVLHVQDLTKKADCSTSHQDYRNTEIIFNAEDVWKSTILMAKNLRIVKPTPLEKFLRPVKGGNFEFDDRVMTIDDVKYLWSFDAEANSYTMREREKSKSEVICTLELTLKNTVVGSNLRDATLTIYNYPYYEDLRETIISCAVIFLNDYEKYRVDTI